jgi:hypothetical protein
VEDYLFSRPSSSFGYYRGNVVYGGDTGTQGVNMAGTGVFSAGQGNQSGNMSGWTPTILYLFLLILAEMFVFAFIARKV